MGVVNVDDPPEGPVFADFASSSEAQIAKDEMGRAVGVTLTKVTHEPMKPSLGGAFAAMGCNGRVPCHNIGLVCCAALC